MDADSIERPRIKAGDCLYECLQELERAGAALPVGDWERLCHWLEACGDVLGQVPCPMQRLSWALGLAQSMNRMGACVQLVVGELLRRALEIQKEAQP